MVWQPIKTAPIDGTKIIVWVNDQVSTAVWDKDDSVKNPRPFWRYSYVLGKDYQRRSRPSHWMAMPEAPQ